MEIWAWGLPPGLGGYGVPGERLDGRLMGALGDIPAIKGVEIGAGFENAGLVGSTVHDPMLLLRGHGRTTVVRPSNRAGGIEGGMTNGMPIVVRAAMKPIPTLTKPLPSVDIAEMQATTAHKERSDVTAVPAARVVAEAMVAIVLASICLEQLGGDSMKAFLSSFESYVAGLEARGLWAR
jgi:chorismate synthase